MVHELGHIYVTFLSMGGTHTPGGIAGHSTGPSVRPSFAPIDNTGTGLTGHAEDTTVGAAIDNDEGPVAHKATTVSAPFPGRAGGWSTMEERGTSPSLARI